MALQIAIFLISAAALAYEILLMRLLSIVQWQHFAAMIISVALLGYGASGTFVTLFRRFLQPRFVPAFAGSAVAFALTTVGSFVVGQRLPFNALELPWNARQLLILAALYLIFAIPFFFAATCLVLAFARAGGRIAGLYRADLAGAGAGALGVLFLLGVLSPAGILKIVAGAGLAAAAAFLVPIRLWVSLLLVAAVLGVGLTPPSLAWLRISQFKPLAQTLRIPGAIVAEERWNALGLVSAVESREVPLRFAPGLSLNFFGELPEQVGLFTDAAALTVVNRLEPEKLEYLDYLTSSLPYYLRTPSRILVLHAGGGTEVLNGLKRQVGEIDALEVHPAIIELVSNRYGKYSGEIYRHPSVSVYAQQPRAFLAAQRNWYDLIIDSSGAAAGMPVLAENYLYTTEGIEQLVRHLSPAGMLAITRQVNVPPRDVLKLFATALAALQRVGVEQTASHVALIRGWNAATLLVSRTRLTEAELNALGKFCEERSLDIAFYPGMPRSEANRFNVLDEPFFYDGAVALVSPQRRQFVSEYKFNIAPATDDRPFFGHFFRWRSLPELLRLRTRGGAPLLELGYLILVATLGQAALAAFILILAPIGARSRAQLRAPGAGHVVICFAALGLSFLFIEIVAIQKLTLLFGNPITAMATALGAFLVFAGIGSGLSSRVHSLGPPVLLIAGLVVVYAVAWTGAGRLLFQLPQVWKVLGAVAAIAPLGIAMGVPFPVAMRAAGDQNAGFVPWAWSINGCASVISPVGATLLAVHAGFTAVTAAAVILYAAAAFAFNRLTSA